MQIRRDALWECLTWKLDEEVAKRDQQVRAGEEESRVDIMMDMTKMDYMNVAEQGQLPAAVQAIEDKVYAHLVKL